MQLIHVYLHTLDAPGAKIRDLVASHLYKHAQLGKYKYAPGANINDALASHKYKYDPIGDDAAS